MSSRLSAVLAIAVVSACHPATIESPSSPHVVTLTGLLTSVWGDPPGGLPQLLLQLTVADGRTIPLEIPESVLESAGGLQAVNNRRVEIAAVQTSAGSIQTTRVRMIRVVSEGNAK
jgi:hypothetical protein